MIEPRTEAPQQALQEAPETDDQLVDGDLVEEISIDGMCGVY